MTITPGQGRRNAADTRARIIDTARDSFTRKPFAQVSLNAIAADAGVSAPLIIKYFSSKQGLLQELIDFTPTRDAICESDFGGIGRALAADALRAGHATTSSLISLLMATAGYESAVTAVTDKFQDVVGGALFSRIRDEAPGVTCDTDAEQRCQCALAMYAGLGTVLADFTRGIPLVDAAVTTYGSHIQNALTTPTDATAVPGTGFPTMAAVS